MMQLVDAEDPRLWLEAELARRGILKRDFAAAIGVTPGQLTNHIRRVRTLSLACEEQVIRVLGLEDEDAIQYRALAERDRLESADERHRADARVLAGRLRRRASPWPVDASHEEIPLGALILRELTQIRGFRPDVNWLAAQLPSPTTPEQAQEWLCWAQQRGLLRLSAEGTLVAAPQLSVVATEPLPSTSTRGLFAQLRALGQEALDRYDRSCRHFGLLFQAVPAPMLPILQRELSDLRLRIQARCDHAIKQGEAGDRVFGLIQQLIPLTRPLGVAVLDPVAELPRREPSPTAEGARLYESLDYRDALATWRTARGLTLEQVAKKIRRNLPPDEHLARQHIHAVLTRQAHCNAAQLRAWTLVLNLDGLAQRYMAASLAWQLARDPVERDQCWALLSELRQLGLGTHLRRLGFELLRNWQPATLLEIARHPQVPLEPGTLRQLLLPDQHLLEPVEDTLSLLTQLGCLRRTPAGALEVAVGATLQVHPEDMTRDDWRLLLRDTLRLGAWAETELPVAERGVHALIQAVPLRLLPEIFADLEETRTRIQGRMDKALTGSPAGEGSDPVAPQLPDRVWLLTLQCFPLSVAPQPSG